MSKKRIPPDSTLDELKRNLEVLRLFAVIEHLDEAIEQASSLEQGCVSFLAGLVQRQVLSNNESSAQRRIRNAGFPAVKTFEQFDWQFQKGLNVQMVKDLMNLHYIKQARPVLLLGRPGTGKTHNLYRLWRARRRRRLLRQVPAHDQSAHFAVCHAGRRNHGQARLTSR